MKKLWVFYYSSQKSSNFLSFDPILTVNVFDRDFLSFDFIYHFGKDLRNLEEICTLYIEVIMI